MITKGLSLSCSPNPLNSTGKVEFYLESPSAVRIDIFDLQGRYVQNICYDRYGSGSYSVLLERGTLSDGVYILRMTTEKGISSQRLIIR